MTSVSVVVPTYRRPDRLRLTVAALAGVDRAGMSLELIVVDDAADPRTAGVIEPFQAGGASIRLLSQHQKGAAAARNAGARVATGEVILFCDDDFIVGPEHVQLHLSTRREYGDVLIGGLWQYSPHVLRELESTPFGRFRIGLESQFRAQWQDVSLNRTCFETQTLSACDLSIRRETFWGLGGFDESFPYAGTEDQDLSLRARRAGYRLIRNRQIQPLHNESWVTFREFCAREERGAQTVVALAQKHPQVLGDFVRHESIGRDDSVVLVATKLLKSFLSSDRPLAALHTLVTTLEGVGAPDAILATLYRRLIGLHLFRGYREGRGSLAS